MDTIKIVVQNDIADQIRRSNGQVELVDCDGLRVGLVRRLPTQEDIALAKGRSGGKGPNVTIEELIAKVESL
jgi:hypothetical protein